MQALESSGMFSSRMVFGYHGYNLNGVYEKRIFDSNWKAINKDFWVKEDVAYIVSDSIPKVTL